jgi:hypothetical protein
MRWVENKHWQKQIPPLRCAMTNKRTGKGHGNDSAAVSG